MRFSNTKAFLLALLLGLSANNTLSAPVPDKNSLQPSILDDRAGSGFRPFRPKPDEPDVPPANTIPKPGTSDPISGGSGPVSGRPFGTADPKAGLTGIGDDPPASPNRVPPTDMTTKGYAYQLDSTFAVSETNPVFVVSKPGVSDTLDHIEIDKGTDSIGVVFANNKIDTSLDRLPLRQIVLDLWNKESGKNIGDLKSINYQTVKNDEMKDALPLAYSKLGDGQTYDPVEIKGTGVTLTPGMEAYDVIMNTPFGGGAKKMLDETTGLEGRQINSIDLFQEDGVDVQFNF